MDQEATERFEIKKFNSLKHDKAESFFERTDRISSSTVNNMEHKFELTRKAKSQLNYLGSL